MAEVIKCKALMEFSRYVTGHGVVHGDPDSSDKAAKNPGIPAHKIAEFAEDGLIQAPKGYLAEQKAIAAADADEIAKAEREARESAAAAAVTAADDADEDGAPI